MGNRFEAIVYQASGIIRDRLEDWELWESGNDDLGSRLAKDYWDLRAADDHAKQLSNVVPSFDPPARAPEFLRRLIERSKRSRPCWDAVKSIADHKVLSGEVPVALRYWLVEYGDQRPSQAPGPKRVKGARDYAITEAIRELEASGMKTTRSRSVSEKCCPEGKTKCDAAGIAWLKHTGGDLKGEAVSYATVEGIWVNNRNTPDFLAFLPN